MRQQGGGGGCGRGGGCFRASYEGVESGSEAGECRVLELDVQGVVAQAHFISVQIKEKQM